MDSLQNRLILSHIFLVLLITLLIGTILIYVLEKQVILVNLSIQLSRQAGLLTEIANDYPSIWGDPAPAQAFINRFRGRMTAQLMLLNAQGEILASSDPNDTGQLGQILPEPGLQTILAGGEDVVQVNYSQDLRAEIVDIFTPVFGPDHQVVGVIRLTHLLATVSERFSRVRAIVLQVLAAGLLIGIAAGLVLAVTMKQPIDRLTRAIHQLSGGEQLDPLPENGPAEIRLLIKAFNGLVERLRSLTTARRQLLANLVHELSQPLGALAAANYALRHGAADEVSLRNELLRGVDIELHTLQRLVDDLARFYDEILGALELELKPTRLSDWLSTVLAPWRESAQRKGLAWQASWPDDLPTVQIDPDRLGQALGNLVGNAIKYTPAGGAVSVEVDLQDGAARIRVTDTGIGITLEEQARIFEPFYRGQAKTQFPQGMGLGLTIARDLIVAHGGRLELEAQPERGSCFTVRLPLNHSAQPA